MVPHGGRTTRYAADAGALARAGVTGVNFRLSLTVPLLEQLAATVAGGTILPPPITRISLEEVPARLGAHGHADGKTVIVL